MCSPNDPLYDKLLEARAALLEARRLLARNRTVSDDSVITRNRRALDAENLILDALDNLNRIALEEAYL